LKHHPKMRCINCTKKPAKIIVARSTLTSNACTVRCANCNVSLQGPSGTNPLQGIVNATRLWEKFFK